MFIVAALGLFVNIVMAKVLHHHPHHHHHNHNHHHDHDHDHIHIDDNNAHRDFDDEGDFERIIPDDDDDDEEEDSKETSPLTGSHSDLNLKAAFIHVVGDILQSIGVLIASIIIWIKPEYRIADPICTFVFSVIVVISTVNILRDAVHILMEGTIIVSIFCLFSHYISISFLTT
jgi:zinc transporter 2